MKVINFGKNEINGGSIWINVSHKKSNINLIIIK